MAQRLLVSQSVYDRLAPSYGERACHPRYRCSPARWQACSLALRARTPSPLTGRSTGPALRLTWRRWRAPCCWVTSCSTWSSSRRWASGGSWHATCWPGVRAISDMAASTRWRCPPTPAATRSGSNSSQLPTKTHSFERRFHTPDIRFRPSPYPPFPSAGSGRAWPGSG